MIPGHALNSSRLSCFSLTKQSLLRTWAGYHSNNQDDFFKISNWKAQRYIKKKITCWDNSNFSPYSTGSAPQLVWVLLKSLSRIVLLLLPLELFFFILHFSWLVLESPGIPAEGHRVTDMSWSETEREGTREASCYPGDRGCFLPSRQQLRGLCSRPPLLLCLGPPRGAGRCFQVNSGFVCLAAADFWTPC